MTYRVYTNPILPGFHPDPSIIRVEDDYYMVNSTFQYFPAIVISHSRDLVHWRYIGHAITRNEDINLLDLPDSYGIWAPDISYVNGMYYIFATLRLAGSGRANIMMKSVRPEGPYSSPVVINTMGIDPSHFVDDDGTRYMVYGSKGAQIVKLNKDSTAAVEEPVHLWEGTGRIAPEGPHIIKKDGYYYIILAEGGTEYGHCITAARSKSLYGPYEASPFDPVHTQSDRQAQIQRAGHGKLVQTQHGEWWIVHLGGRPLGGGYCTLGRETYLEPVQWTKDGWFTVNEGNGPSLIQRAPNLNEVVYSEPELDEFAGKSLPLHWQFVRNPEAANWSLTERPSHIRIWTSDGELDSIRARNILLRRERHHHYTASMKLEFQPKHNGEQAGLVCYYDSRCYISLSSIYDQGLKLKLEENRAQVRSCLAVKDIVHKGALFLKVVVNAERRMFYYSLDLIEWYEIGRVDNALFLSDEGTLEKKSFTGTMVGFYALHGGSGRRIPADIDWFLYQTIDH
ncbi:glycoside hydrolase family 43 protein [Paenibacillus sp. FSL W7-1287]|uniref:glycoside hydrolase family 43 protein n=1 Tax=Paenibacillus sp. FSL W7-1287 TaxID=2954538 RepID=UPI0030F786EE